MKALLAGICVLVVLLSGCGSSGPAVPAPPAYTPAERPDSKPATVTLRPDDRVGWDVRVYRAPHPLDPRCLRQPYSPGLALGDGEAQAAMFVDVDQVKPTEKRLKSLGHAVLLARRAMAPASIADGETSTVQEWIDVSWVQPGLSKGQPPGVWIASHVSDGAIALDYGWVPGPNSTETRERIGPTVFPPRHVSGVVCVSRFDHGAGGWWYVAIAEPVIVHQGREKPGRAHGASR